MAFWLGRSPSTFYCFYTAQIVTLLTIRCACRVLALAWHAVLRSRASTPTRSLHHQQHTREPNDATRMRTRTRAHARTCNRLILYRRQRTHYYMLDLCYAANCLLLAHIWLAPRSALLNKARRTHPSPCWGRHWGRVQHCAGRGAGGGGGGGACKH
jgi:hypothetical protein